MHLGIAELVAHVLEPFGCCQFAGAFEHSRGDIDADDRARRRGMRGLARRQPGPAADVEDLITWPDPVGGSKAPVMRVQLSVVEVQPRRRRH
jgi:hypothetical protein